MATSDGNRMREWRDRLGWSQQDLAQRAGVSRAAVSAIEVARLAPSVTAALALARALGASVEELFAAGPPAPEWAWPPKQIPPRYWLAEVGGRVLRFPVESPAAGGEPHDGIFPGPAPVRLVPLPRSTLVIACCDPAIGLLAGEYARRTGYRILSFSRSSRQALSLLGAGLVHVAGTHFAGGNRAAARESLDGPIRLLHVARWEEGLALGPRSARSSVGSVVRSRLRWVGREAGSGARECQDEVRPGKPPNRVAFDHRGVAEAVRCGWADVGVCHRLPCEEAGLRFLSVRREPFDLCFPAAFAVDPRSRPRRRGAVVNLPPAPGGLARL